jgi:hypothetical protein
MLAYKNIGATYTQDQLAAQLSNLTPQDVGAIVTITYANTCQGQDPENISESTQAYCTELEKAFNGGATEADIGTCLIEKLKDPNYSNPPCI